MDIDIKETPIIGAMFSERFERLKAFMEDNYMLRRSDNNLLYNKIENMQKDMRKLMRQNRKIFNYLKIKGE
jgi:hypothetical protein